MRMSLVPDYGWQVTDCVRILHASCQRIAWKVVPIAPRKEGPKTAERKMLPATHLCTQRRCTYIFAKLYCNGRQRKLHLSPYLKLIKFRRKAYCREVALSLVQSFVKEQMRKLSVSRLRLCSRKKARGKIRINLRHIASLKFRWCGVGVSHEGKS